ncbi:hypothetical protein [Vibrio viridaestus]|uniref:Tetratricopeptide repeat protein n=1 Tax=Vibrio viridaestus TaxID=2487322 RepID=A0A3N9THY0_9VIBR|nr:hypothetical protein [Vibrio viridaestus]RQW63887.1 hypothetical protein EES38_04580 [Vibrio viridaestus]
MSNEKLKTFFMYFVMLVSIFLVVVSFRFGIADLYKVALERQIGFYNKYTILGKIDSPDRSLPTMMALQKSLLGWNSLSPEHNVLSARLETDLFFDSISLSPEQRREHLSSALSYYDRAIKARPLFPDTYVRKAYVMLYAKMDKQDILSELDLAHKYGPYEIIVAQSTIDILFQLWDQLSTFGKKSAIDVILHPNRYGFNKYTFDEAVASSPSKTKICQLANFMKKYIKSCH